MNEDQIFNFLQQEARKIQTFKTSNDNGDLLASIKLRCPSGNLAQTYCLSCNNCSVTCVDEDCHQCYRTHLKCERLKKIRQFHNQIEETVKPSFIFGQIEQSISSINSSLNDMKKNIQNQLKTFKLTQTDKEIVRKIKNYHDNQGNLESKDFLQHQSDKDKNKDNWFHEETSKFELIIERTKQMVLRKFQDIHKTIYYEHLQNCEAFDEKIFQESNILENKTWKNQMLLLLKDLKPIKEVRRIYCASTDAFLSSSFHQLCDNKPNLLYIVRNQFDKTYGAYSPCAISQKRSQTFEIDDSMSSFVFSLDIHIKANLVNKQFSIRNSYKPKNKTNVLVSFGNPNSPNFIVSENSFGMSRDNWVDLYGGAYEQNNDNLQELIGFNGHTMCKLKQFQVFQIFFAKDSQKPDQISTTVHEIKEQPQSKISQQKAMDIEKNNSSYQDNKQKQHADINLQNQQEEYEKLVPKRGGRAKKIKKQTQKNDQKTKTVVKPRGKGKMAAQDQKKEKSGQDQFKPSKRKGRPRKMEVQSQKLSENEDLYKLNPGSENDEQQEEESEQDGVRRIFVQGLFQRPQQRVNPFHLLFGGGNEEESDSHQNRHHGRHGLHNLLRRRHFW